MDVKIETVTPERAEAWLNANKNNRKLRDGVVEQYQSDMEKGRWTQCTAPIAFYEDGDLADLPAIYAAMVRHIEAVQEKAAA